MKRTTRGRAVRLAGVIAAASALLLAGCATVERAPPALSAEAPLPAAFALLDRERPTTGVIAELLPRKTSTEATTEDGSINRDDPRRRLDLRTAGTPYSWRATRGGALSA